MTSPIITHWVHSRDAPDEALASVHLLEVACQRVVSPREPVRSGSEAVGWFRSPPPDEPRSLWLLTDPDKRRPAATAWLGCQANATGVARVLVDPAYRRNGLGTRLFDVVRSAAHDAGLRVITGTTTSPEVREVLVRHGARAGHTQVRQVLDLAATPLPRRASPDAPDGVHIVTWVAALPEPLLSAYAAARDAINDAPMDSFDREVWTAGRIRDLERAVAARGVQTLGTALVEGGRILGYTEMRVSEATGSVAATQDTAIVRDQRRRGYGSLLKTASLDFLRATRPDVQFVTTSNDTTNEAMLRINRAAGFEPVAFHSQLSLDLTPQRET